MPFLAPKISRALLHEDQLQTEDATTPETAMPDPVIDLETGMTTVEGLHDRHLGAVDRRTEIATGKIIAAGAEATVGAGVEVAVRDVAAMDTDRRAEK